MIGNCNVPHLLCNYTIQPVIATVADNVEELFIQFSMKEKFGHIPVMHLATLMANISS